MFDPVSPQVSFTALDHEVLARWDRDRIYEATLELRKDGKPFVFYEGPPTANGMPHAGHVLTRVMKDIFLRYRSMCGYHVPRRAGWDTHGLPVEVEVEKMLKISGKQAIAEYGVEAFSKQCIDSVFRYIEEWRRMTRRIGFWVDLDDAYVTFHKSYVESVWWALKQLFDQGLLYQDYKVVWWWAQGGTALSAGEVGQGYKEIDDPSVTIRFPLKNEPGTAFLAWTTTPWTLPSNIGLAVKPDATYVTVEFSEDAAASAPVLHRAGERVIVAEARVADLLHGAAHTIVDRKLGSDLVGVQYTPPFAYAEPVGGRAFEVIAADFVELGSGSGLVHMAPAFGEDDFRACKAAGLGFLQLVQPDGTFPPEVTPFAGRFCKEADRDIIRHLRKEGLLFREQVYRHEYPFSWRRMSDPLIQYARTSWFIRTTKEIESVKANNQQTTWQPEHIKDGRFGQFLAGNVDWALSRERFWGTPLPLWKNDVTGRVQAVDSVKAIEALNPRAFDAFYEARKADPTLSEDLIVHKPWIDDVTFTLPGEEGVYRRVTEVIDCWFDSGCMPFAQWGYPHKNQDAFAANFPADFITEAVDQTRGWFYSLMMVSNLLFPEKTAPHPFRNCVVLGLLTDKDGLKYSKSLKNYTDPLELMEQVGGDAVRWALYSNTVPGQNTRFFEGAVRDAAREFLLKVWNVYSFFVTYANIDGFDPKSMRPAVAERSDLDRYILAELDFTIGAVRDSLETYSAHVAVRHITSFVDALSNWYVRRSRGRFWAEGTSEDKTAAFATLYECLVDLVQLTAPFVPFVSDQIYRNLTSQLTSAKASVHLCDFPSQQADRRSDELRLAVARTRALVTAGSRVRNENRLKVRQPLREAIIVVAGEDERASIERFSDAIREELNVLELKFTTDPGTFVHFRLLPNFPKLGPKLGKDLPACKAALASANGAELHDALASHGVVHIDVAGRSIELTREEIEVRLEAKEGFAAASEQGRVVVLDTTISPELRRMGLAREVLSKIQKTRKDRDLAYEARIHVRWQADGELADALREAAPWIASETLALTFAEATLTSDFIDVDDCRMRLEIEL